MTFPGWRHRALLSSEVGMDFRNFERRAYATGNICGKRVVLADVPGAYKS